MTEETSIQKMKTKHILCLLTAAALSACSNMETSSGSFVNTPALQQMGDTFDRANAYQRKGYSPGDAWQAARYDNPGGPFGPLAPMGPTPIAGYGWGAGTTYSR
jgi:hypothetical protein